MQQKEETQAAIIVSSFVCLIFMQASIMMFYGAFDNMHQSNLDSGAEALFSILSYGLFRFGLSNIRGMFTNKDKAFYRWLVIFNTLGYAFPVAMIVYIPRLWLQMAFPCAIHVITFIMMFYFRKEKK